MLPYKERGDFEIERRFGEEERISANLGGFIAPITSMKDNKEVLAGKDGEMIRIPCISSRPNFGKKKEREKFASMI